MALRWDWDEKCGEATITQKRGDEVKEYTLTLYQGNAFLIMLNEFEEDGKQMWAMWNFFISKDHAKRCLGLDKTYSDENMFDEDTNRLTKIRLNKAKMGKADLKALVTMLIQAFDHITIEIFNEPNDVDKVNN